MTSKDSVRKLAALGAGLAMAATMVSGLLAAPDYETCALGSSLAVNVSADITVTGAPR
jgi:hypothetical protein